MNRSALSPYLSVFLLEDLLLWKLFLPLCARSTSECFDSCRLSAEISMRTEHRQWGLMKQRGCCEADGSCVASSLPHNQSVTASICPPDTHASIWKNSILVAWLHTLCLLSRWRHGGLFCSPHPLLQIFTLGTSCFFWEAFWGFGDSLCTGFIW